MNFFKHHLGDYAKDTAHLSWMEDMAYTRAMRVYYLREKPLPLNRDECDRLLRAVTRREKEAVTLILSEFFLQQTDGWHNKRCDQEIEKYQAQASTNRRIARQRTVNDSSDEPSTNRTPNHKPDTRYQIPDTRTRKTEGQKQGARKRAVIRPDCVSEKVWGDFMEVRKAKRAPLTATALEGIEREARKAGITLQAALETCCSRGWQGFDAGWVNGSKPGNRQEALEARNHAATEGWMPPEMRAKNATG